ncbi:MAG: GntR family transcriptional regulator [Pseudomonadota bacterium]
MSTNRLPDWILSAPSGGIGGLKADRAYDALRRAILFRLHEPGDQLLEQQLAHGLGCSQGTVREALLRLAEDGLVERRGYRGTVVTETTLAEAVEMVRVRLSIERSVAMTLAQQGLGDGAEEIERILGEMDAAHGVGDLDRSSVLDRAFHAALAQAAGLGLLRPVLHRCALHIHRFTLGGVEVPRDFFQEAGVGAEHRALLDAILSGGGERASAAISAHLAQVLLRWAPSLHDAVGAQAFALPVAAEGLA